VKRLLTATAAELDALLPSILDKAFKGELWGQWGSTRTNTTAIPSA
jgi:hypothetical protein